MAVKEGAYANDTIVLKACLTHVGRTSMEVRVDTFVEELSGEQHMINRAYLVMVALDEDGRPAPVPPLVCETVEEKQEWDAALERLAYRKQRRP